MTDPHAALMVAARAACEAYAKIPVCGEDDDLLVIYDEMSTLRAAVAAVETADAETRERPEPYGYQVRFGDRDSAYLFRKYEDALAHMLASSEPQANIHLVKLIECPPEGTP